VINVRRIITILGILLIVTILISGSVVAPYIISAAGSVNCTNQTYATGSPDTQHATAGKNSPPTLGVLRLDFGSGNEMDPDQIFTVYASSAMNESYGVQVESHNSTVQTAIGNGWDTQNCDFTTPSESGWKWRWVIITGSSGVIAWNDAIYGPEVDAVGYT
jgi:hypothetical protein